jgi:hypothetical protein
MTIWHPEVILESVRATLVELGRLDLVSEFYLAGGTGLALQFGHRRSADLDLFFEQSSAEQRWLGALSSSLVGFSLIAIAPETLHFRHGTTKVSLLGYHYPLLFAVDAFHGISVAEPRDIACMKISAVAARGTKRDFVDLYFAARKYGFEELLELFERKYAQVRYSKMHILKSLTYFADAEKDPLPDMLAAVDWKEVKGYFVREAAKLV